MENENQEQPMEQEAQEPRVETPSPPQDNLGIGPEPDQNAFDDYGDYMKAQAGYEGRKAVALARMQEQRVRQTPEEQMKAAGYDEGEVEAAKWQDKRQKLNILGESSLDGDPNLQTPQSQRAVKDFLEDYNSGNRDNIIVLPKQPVGYGETAEIKPSDMLFYELEPATIAEVRRIAPNYAGNYFQQIHRALDALGYSGKGKPTVIWPDPEKEEEAQDERPKDPDAKWRNMSQAEFEKWAEKRGLPRR